MLLGALLFVVVTGAGGNIVAALPPVAYSSMIECYKAAAVVNKQRHIRAFCVEEG